MKKVFFIVSFLSLFQAAHAVTPLPLKYNCHHKEWDDWALKIDFVAQKASFFDNDIWVDGALLADDRPYVFQSNDPTDPWRVTFDPQVSRNATLHLESDFIFVCEGTN